MKAVGRTTFKILALYYPLTVLARATKLTILNKINSYTTMICLLSLKLMVLSQ